ncbi:D-xylose ABC transporter substrate-binding protein [Effusibacillus consociatus]|uniref:D-xylose ABC transporter substrate-binding protein n=1 Tax=Effusibacillus consociatus TaxID=1117041 RepID=A0ABV9Q450_9BACL
MKIWTKRVFTGLLTVVLASGVTACSVVNTGSSSKQSDEAKKDKKIVVGFSMDTLKEERWQKDKALFEKKVRELGADVKTLAANGDSATQLSQAEQLISEGVDVLVVVPYNAEAAAAIVKKAHDAGIKVLSYDRLIKNADVDLYVSFDNVRVGEMQAKAIVAKAPKGNFAYIGGADTDNNAILFRQGAMNVLKPLADKGDIKIVYDQYSKDWKPEEALKNMENALTANKNNIQAVVAANDGTAGGVVQALKGQNLAGKLPVSGQDAELAALQRIVEGTQTMTVYKPITKIANMAAELAVKMAKKETVTEAEQKVNNGKIDVPSVLLPPVPVSKENLVETVIKDGYQKLEEVFKYVPKDQWPKVN